MSSINLDSKSYDDIERDSNYFLSKINREEETARDRAEAMKALYASFSSSAELLAHRAALEREAIYDANTSSTGGYPAPNNRNLHDSPISSLLAGIMAPSSISRTGGITDRYNVNNNNSPKSPLGLFGNALSNTLYNM